MKELKATDKVTQKMTRDGAVAENLATGEVSSISGREAEVDFSASEEPAATTESVVERAVAEHDRRKAKKSEKADAQTVRDGFGGKAAAFLLPKIYRCETDESRFAKIYPPF